jgi:hypothetical protein
MKRTWKILAAVALMLVAASAVYAVDLPCGHDGTVTWSPDTLWPPDYKLQTINITYTQPCDDSGAPGGCASGAFFVRVDSITSSEEPLPQGCGQPTPPQGPDYTGVGNITIVGTGPGVSEPQTLVTTVQVRAERCVSGNGRIYTIDVTCSEHGETGTATLTVFVPHDLGL